MVWLAAFVVTFAIARLISYETEATPSLHRAATSEKALLAAMFLTMRVLPLLRLGTHEFAFADYALPDWAMWIGVLAQVPFVWLFWRSHVDLDRDWSPSLEVRRDHALVTNGVYAWMRHPMYAAIWIAALAQPLLLQNWIAGALIIPACPALWLLRVPKEEAMMRETFGAAYDDYARQVGRLLPHL